MKLLQPTFEDAHLLSWLKATGMIKHSRGKVPPAAMSLSF